MQIIGGWLKSSFGFFHNTFQKNWMNFLANPKLIQKRKIPLLKNLLCLACQVSCNNADAYLQQKCLTGE